MMENTLTIPGSEMTRAKSVPILSQRLPQDCDDEDDDGEAASCHGNGDGCLYSEKAASNGNGGVIKFNVTSCGEGDGEHCQVEGAAHDTTLKSSSMAESARIQAVERLQGELKRAQEALQLKDEEVAKLSRVQSEMDKELEELTASLFQEAHGMVNEANVKRAAAEKQCQEALSKIDVLQAEVSALKTLVITSTPSMHYRKSKLGFHRGSSHHSSKQQPFVPTHQKAKSVGGLAQMQMQTKSNETDSTGREIDPLLYKEFMTWKGEASIARDSNFMKRILTEDVLPCLNFMNGELSSALLSCIEENSLCMEPIMLSSYPKKCALTGVQKVCKYRFRLGETDRWHNITSNCRDRITKVCDFYTYLRYIRQGLVKAEEKDKYWEIIRLRCEMSMAKLGV
ncbi:guanine nucleotide exchange factor for Rab-3A-like [Ptychodera flava]|uniref:guanine nucleotide exchange factor for Rab-3A-like n=1 Tax=Ptychodera flava TaxID=63121 RepID=UPI00396AAF34